MKRSITTVNSTQYLIVPRAIIGDAEVKLLPDNLRLFSGCFWQILAKPGYFLATLWLILTSLG